VFKAVSAVGGVEETLWRSLFVEPTTYPENQSIPSPLLVWLQFFNIITIGSRL